MRLIVLFWVFCLCSWQLHAQEARIRGALQATPAQADGAAASFELYLPALKLLTAADDQGFFELGPLNYGTYTLVIRYGGLPVDSIRVVVNTALVELGTIAVLLPASETTIIAEQPAATTTQEEGPHEDEEGTGHISPILHASARDPFTNTAGFILAGYNFRPRGGNRQQIWVNGTCMNDLVSGSPGWSQWSGLNDVFRNANGIYGLSPTEYAFGDVQGSRYYDINPAVQSRQSKVTYSLSSKTYAQRVMVTQSTGVSDKGWAFSFSAGRRWAAEGYVPGTFVNAYSYYAGVSKYTGARSLLSAVLFGSFSERGKAAAATDELFDLSGSHYYNPNWGFQGGRLRNARVNRQHIPVLMVNFEHQPTEKILWRSALCVQAGNTSNSALDWYKAPDPRPDYYRNLPSYFAADDPATAAALSETLRSDPNAKLQVDWQRLYSANYSNYEWLRNANGVSGKDVYGRRSLYVIGNDVEQVRKISLGSSLHMQLPRRSSWDFGVHARLQQTSYYRELADLLGGDYFLNNNMFAEQQFPANAAFMQQDLNVPDRAVRQGERYRYHFRYDYRQIAAWSQLQTDLRKWHLFAAARVSCDQYSRTGYYRSGLFPDHSEGTVYIAVPLAFSGKAGLTYKINGRNYLFANAAMVQEDPGVDNRFIAPRTRDQVLENVPLQLTQSIEGGYLMKAPRLNIRAVFYATFISNATSIRRFYNDDPAYQTFVNYAMQDISMQMSGTELALAWQLNPVLSLQAVAALGQAFYTGNPRIQVFNDNDTVLQPGTRQAYIKNYYLPAGPQCAYSTGASYNGRRYWFARINASYLAQNYVAVNPDRRTYEAAGLIPAGSPQYNAIYTQERLDPFFVLDVSGGKSLRLRKISKAIAWRWTLNLNAGVSNVLNNRNIKTGGYEQLRYDFANNNPVKFPSKYFYGYGRTFLLSLGLKY